jgi:hypothetical protein
MHFDFNLDVEFIIAVRLPLVPHTLHTVEFIEVHVSEAVRAAVLRHESIDCKLLTENDPATVAATANSKAEKEKPWRKHISA